MPVGEEGRRPWEPVWERLHQPGEPGPAQPGHRTTRAQPYGDINASLGAVARGLGPEVAAKRQRGAGWQRDHLPMVQATK